MGTYKDRGRGDFGGDKARELTTNDGCVHRVHKLRCCCFVVFRCPPLLCPALSDNVSQHRSCPTTAHLSLDLSPGSSPWFEYSMPLTRLSQLNLTFNSCPSAYTMLLMAVDSAVVEILSRRWTSCRSDVVATMMVTEVCLSVHPYNTRWWRRTSPCRRPFLFLDYYFTALGGDGRPKYFGEIYFCHIEARCAGTINIHSTGAETFLFTFHSDGIARLCQRIQATLSALREALSDAITIYLSFGLSLGCKPVSKLIWPEATTNGANAQNDVGFSNGIDQSTLDSGDLRATPSKVRYSTTT